MKFKVATVTPIWRESLHGDDLVSCQHLFKYLPNCEHVAVCPHGLRLDDRRFRVVSFSPDYFQGPLTYNRLMTSKRFYAAFREFDYILIYHLDALVLDSDIEKWCELSYSYLGAPLWINQRINDVILSVPPEVQVSKLEDLARYQIGTLVGNGGFSLRRVKDHLETLESTNFFESSEEYYQRRYAGRGKREKLMGLFFSLLKKWGYKNTVRWFVQTFGGNEDRFWSENANSFNPNFRVAPVETALDFAFEVAPSMCYTMNGRRLPFGSHAWAKYDRAFWEPHLLSAET